MLGQKPAWHLGFSIDSVSRFVVGGNPPFWRDQRLRAEMVHAAVRGEDGTCFVPRHARLPFMTMPEAAEATLALASAPRSCLKQNVYAVGGFAPTAAEPRRSSPRAVP